MTSAARTAYVLMSQRALASDYGGLLGIGNETAKIPYPTIPVEVSLQP
jgi:hypothetical protein